MPKPHRPSARSGAAAHPNDCPLCDQAAGVERYRRPASGRWQVRAIAHPQPETHHHEVIIETPHHGRRFSSLTHQEQLDALAAYRHRLNALYLHGRVNYVRLWKNNQAEHAHSQIMARAVLPPEVAAERQARLAYRDEHGNCAICDLVTWEEHQGVRLIYQDKYLAALAPRGTTVPLEAWLIPRRHEGTLSGLNGAELDSLATALGHLSARLDAAAVGFSWVIDNGLPREHHHLILKLTPHSRRWDGPILEDDPEFAALWYHGKI